MALARAFCGRLPLTSAFSAYSLGSLSCAIGSLEGPAYLCYRGVYVHRRRHNRFRARQAPARYVRVCAVIEIVQHYGEGASKPCVGAGRLHMLAWVSALVAGTANDAFFMWIPIVDNFWQAQASIMLSPRMPLYISCCYINFMYFSTVAVWKLKLPVRGLARCQCSPRRLRMGVAATELLNCAPIQSPQHEAEAVLVGLCAEMIYAPYDIVGACTQTPQLHTL